MERSFDSAGADRSKPNSVGRQRSSRRKLCGVRERCAIRRQWSFLIACATIIRCVPESDDPIFGYRWSWSVPLAANPMANRKHHVKWMK
jgi:hypothetical protein